MNKTNVYFVRFSYVILYSFGNMEIIEKSVIIRLKADSLCISMFNVRHECEEYVKHIHNYHMIHDILIINKLN